VLDVVQPRFDDAVIKSKREGYVELTGEIVANLGNATFIARSIQASTKPITITLHYDHQTVLIDESAGTLWRMSSGKLEKEIFKLPYQSEMTGIIFDQLISNSTCDLTPYTESAAAHLTLLRTFAYKAGTVSDTHAECAIT
jgi:hypothetical protein